MDELIEWFASLFKKTTPTTTTSSTPQTITVGKTAYINKVADTGWIDVILSSSKDRVSLYLYTKLTILKFEKSRCYFKIEEGHYKNQTASMGEANAKIYIGKNAPQQSPALITATKAKRGIVYSVAKNRNLTQQVTSFTAGSVSGSSTLNTAEAGAQFTALPKGRYEIMVPDVPHTPSYTRGYRDLDARLKYDQVWFPIKYGNNTRYVHVGNVSEGCFTVMDLDKFTLLHNYLLSHRDKNNTIVGYLEIN